MRLKLRAKVLEARLGVCTPGRIRNLRVIDDIFEPLQPLRDAPADPPVPGGAGKSAAAKAQKPDPPFVVRGNIANGLADQVFKA